MITFLDLSGIILYPLTSSEYPTKIHFSLYTTLWCDNQSAIQLCKDPVQHQRSKHIELHMNFIKKFIHDHVLEVQYFSVDDQVADIFTKALTKAKFTKLQFMVGVQEFVTKRDML